jgi:hypothetical protein
MNTFLMIFLFLNIFNLDLLNFASAENFDAFEIFANLFKMIKCSNEKANYFSSSWSVLSNNVVLSDGNILISSRFLIRFIRNNPENKKISSFKEPLYKLFQVSIKLK